MKRHYECNSPQHGVSRRQILGALAGGAAAGPLSFAGLLNCANAEVMRAQHKQVLFIWLDGGISQLESWDPKPNTEFGGPFRAIPTSVSGVHFSELVPETAQRMHKLAVIRSMCTRDENHSTAVPLIQRGDPKNRGVTYPFLGSALAKLRPPKNDLRRLVTTWTTCDKNCAEKPIAAFEKAGAFPIWMLMSRPTTWRYN